MKKIFIKTVFVFWIGSAVLAPLPHSLLFAASPLAGPPALAPGPLPAIQPNFSAPLIPLAKGARVAPLCDPASPVPCLQQWMGQARPMAVHTGAGGPPSYSLFAPVMLMEKFIRKDADKVKWDGWRPYSSYRRKGGRGSRRRRTQYYVNKKTDSVRRVTVSASGAAEKVEEGQALFVDVNALDRIADENAGKGRGRSAEKDAPRSEIGDSVSDYYGKPAPDGPVLERDKAAQIARQSARQMKTGDSIEREEDRRLQRARQRRQFEQLNSEGQKAAAEARKALDEAKREKLSREKQVTDERERRLKERKAREAMSERGRNQIKSETQRREVMKKIEREAEQSQGGGAGPSANDTGKREGDAAGSRGGGTGSLAGGSPPAGANKAGASDTKTQGDAPKEAATEPQADPQPSDSGDSPSPANGSQAGSFDSQAPAGGTEPAGSSPDSSPSEAPVMVVATETPAAAATVADKEAAQAGCAELHSQIHETEAQEPCVDCVIKGDDSLAQGFEQLDEAQKTGMIAQLKEWLRKALPEVSKRVKGKILTVDKKDDKDKITKVCSLAHDYSLKHIVNNFNNTKENKGCKPMTFERFFPELYCKSCNQGIPPEIMLSVMSAESAGKCLAEGDQGNSVGLFQINSETQSCNGNAKGSQKNKKCLLNLENNLKYGMKILSDKFQSVNGESPVQSSGACPSWAKTDSAQKDRWRRAVSAYNSGEGWLNRAVESVEGDLTKDDSPADWTKGTEHLAGKKGAVSRTGSIKKSQASWEALRLYFFIEKFLPGNTPAAEGKTTGRKLTNSLSNIAHTEAVLGREAPGAPPGLVDFWREYVRANMPSSCPD